MRNDRVVYTLLAGMAASALFVAGCAPLHPRYGEAGFDGEKFLDPQMPSDLPTTGIESADMEAAVGRAVGSMLASEAFAQPGYRPAVAITPDFFSYEGPESFTIDPLVDLLRHEVVSGADGRVRLLSEAYGDLSEAQFAVGAHVTEYQQAGGAVQERYTQIVFEATDLASNEVVFSERYAFKKATATRQRLY